MSEYVTQREHDAAVARLDLADRELRAAISQTERALRGEFTAEIAVIRDDLKDEIEGAREHTSQEVGRVDEHLSNQDRAVFAAGLSLVVYLLVHLVFHIG